jgi:hypothetical protein
VVATSKLANGEKVILFDIAFKFQSSSILLIWDVLSDIQQKNKKEVVNIVLLDASNRNADNKRVVIVVINNNNNISECGLWFENVHSNSESDNY